MGEGVEAVFAVAGAVAGGAETAEGDCGAGEVEEDVVVDWGYGGGVGGGIRML